MTEGKVWLVGAGPSDAGLLTIKGKKVLSEAEVVVYDRLVGQEILLMIPEGAEKIDAGKRAGNHTVCQEEINHILLRRAQEGKRVVRLKGGDPFLFGRGGEELELLTEHGIPYEVVPGVTSAISVPAYCGIPVTHRDCASSLHIMTGHRKKGEPLAIDFEALVRTGGTLVFLMGVASLPEICSGLLRAGMDPQTPAALLQQGTTADQKKIVSTVSALEEEARRQGSKPPGILIVGEVCAYSESFSWYEKLPLFGAKIAVTRPRERSAPLSERLRGLGAQVLELPAIRTVPITPNPALDEAVLHLSEYDYLVFTSPAGVRYFFEALAERRADIRSFGGGKIAAIGQGTAGALRRYGLFADIVPEIYDGEHLGIAVGADCRGEDRILIPRSGAGGQELIAQIRRRSRAQITDLPVYDTVCESQEFVDERAGFESGEITMAVFTSASTVRGFAAATRGLDYGRVTAACIGRQTKAAADALGMRAYMAREATVEALTELIVEIHRHREERPEAPCE